MTQAITTAPQGGNGNQIVQARRASVLASLADRYEMDPNRLLETLKATCIKGNATNEQVQAFCIVANRYGLDPFLKQIHAFAAQGGGIVPIVGIDGWAKIINEQDRFDGFPHKPKYTYNEKGELVSCEVSIAVKDRTHPVTIEEFFDECYRNTVPWNTMKRRMLRHKALMQCARIAFGIGGIFDEDEGRDIENNDKAAAPVAQERGVAATAKRIAAKAAPAESKDETTGNDPEVQDAETNVEQELDAETHQNNSQEQQQDQSEEDLSDYPTFVAKLQEAARVNEIDGEVFDKGYGLALTNIAKKGKGAQTTVEWRKKQLAAIRAGTFDFKTGKVIEQK